MKKIILLIILPFLLVSFLGAKIRVVADLSRDRRHGGTDNRTRHGDHGPGRRPAGSACDFTQAFADRRLATGRFAGYQRCPIGNRLAAAAAFPGEQSPYPAGTKWFSRSLPSRHPAGRADGGFRDQGDVHPDGNPHFLLDPENIALATAAICQSLCQLNPAKAVRYRANLADFQGRWQQAEVQWQKDMESLKNKNGVVYHRLFDYFSGVSQ